MSMQATTRWHDGAKKVAPMLALLAAGLAAVVLVVLGPIKVVHAADEAVEGENFANKPANTPIVLSVTAGNVAAGRSAFRDSAVFPADGGGGTRPAACGDRLDND